MSLSWNRRMTAFCSSSVAVHSCSSSSSRSAVSSSVSIALVPSRSAAVRGQVAMPYEDSQERTSPPSLSHRTAHLSKMGVRPTRSVHNPDELSFGHSPATCPQSDGSGRVAARRQVEAILAETDPAVTVANVLGKHDGGHVGELSADAAAGRDGRWWPTWRGVVGADRAALTHLGGTAAGLGLPMRHGAVLNPPHLSPAARRPAGAAPAAAVAGPAGRASWPALPCNRRSRARRARPRRRGARSTPVGPRRHRRRARPLWYPAPGPSASWHARRRWPPPSPGSWGRPSPAGTSRTAPPSWAPLAASPAGARRRAADRR